MYVLEILLLVPIILAAGKEVQINNYVIKFSNEDQTIVKSIQVFGDLSEVLDLSRLGITDFESNAFKNVGHIKKLIVSYNSIATLQHTSFGNLTNLEYLDLSHNNINTMTKPFADLRNLNRLDLSNNEIPNLEASNFFGLSESCVIFLKGNDISFMSSALFDNKSYPVVSINKQRHKREFSVPAAPSIKICINYTKLISVEHYTKGERLASGCRTNRYHAAGKLRLSSLQIAEFQEGWFKLENSTIHHIDFSDNYITRLISTMFDYLPDSIRSVDLSHNYIVRLEKGIIMNEHLQEIDFYENFIIEIEDDVFINTNLTTLILGRNKLKDTKFVTTLPSTITKIDFYNNEIAKIQPESFSKLNKLETLNLLYNHITVIEKASLRGLTGLEKLDLSKNQIESIEALSFKDLTNLTELHLEYNNLSTLDLGVFASLKNIKRINVEHNELREVNGDTLIDFPIRQMQLDLGYNKLGTLKAGTFVNSSISSLILNHNFIENIENETFNQPHLRSIELQHNYLTVIDNGMFQDFKILTNLNLSKNNITRIEKGAFQSCGNLCRLFLSGNPIKKLEQGALYGLRKNERCRVALKDVPIEMIHGGVFSSS